MILQRLIPILSLAALIAFFSPLSVRADIQHAAAARYIEALFSTNMQIGAGSGEICPDAAAFGRFATGRAWRTFSEAERMAFDLGFCNLATSAVTRLRESFPNLVLDLQQSFPGAPGMTVIAGEVTGASAQPWPIEFSVAAEGQTHRVADMKIVGVSLGIFLRSLAVLLPPRDAGGKASAEGILDAWQRALDRALPPPPAKR